MYYVYLLRSKSERQGYYLGYSSDLKRRLQEHNEGKNLSTRYSQWELVYYEAYQTEKAARLREKRLKAHGRSYQLLIRRVQSEPE